MFSKQEPALRDTIIPDRLDRAEKPTQTALQWDLEEVAQEQTARTKPCLAEQNTEQLPVLPVLQEGMPCCGQRSAAGEGEVWRH